MTLKIEFLTFFGVFWFQAISKFCCLVFLVVVLLWPMDRVAANIGVASLPFGKRSAQDFLNGRPKATAEEDEKTSPERSEKIKEDVFE